MEEEVVSASIQTFNALEYKEMLQLLTEAA